MNEELTMNETTKDTTFVEINGIRMTIPCDKLMEALSKMQGSLDNATKSSDNPYFKSKYADLANCLQTAKKPMAENGLSLSQHCNYDGNFVHCVTILGHCSGQMLVSTLNVPVSKKDAQGIGSAITYARRYALSSVIGLTQKDDDGNGSVGNTKENEKAEAMGKNQEKLDANENWRLVNGNHIEVKTNGGKWVDLENLELKWLEKLLTKPEFADITNFIQMYIDKIKNA